LVCRTDKILLETKSALLCSLAFISSSINPVLYAKQKGQKSTKYSDYSYFGYTEKQPSQRDMYPEFWTH